MNWFIISLVFHILRLNLCVALSSACPDQQYLNASGVCVDCTVCDELDKKIVLRPCSTLVDTICGSVPDKSIDLKGIITPNNGAVTSKDTKSTADTDAAYNYYYYDTDADEDDYDYEYENNSTDLTTKELPKSEVKPSKKPSKKASTSRASPDSGKKPKSKPPKYSFFPPGFLNENVSVVDPDTLIQRTKKLRKMKFKESTVQLDDHSLKIGDTKFEIGDEKNDDGRWLKLSHPHIVDKKIYVDLAAKSLTNKKGSTFFSSGEKQTDQEYFNEMSKLLNETSSLLKEKHPAVFNQTIQINPKNNDYDNNVLKNLDDIGDDDDADDDDEEEEEDSDEEDDEDDDDDDDEPLLVDDFNPLNNSDRTDSGERTDVDMEDDYDLAENDFYQDKTFKQLVDNDIISEPFVSTANWQILILVAAMSACLLFFVVVSAYICIFMRRGNFKTTFVKDVDDISVRVNLMQHARFEVDDSSNIKNYIKHLRSVKSKDEKLPIIYTQNTEKK